MMMPPLNLLSGNMNVEEHMSRSHRSSGLRDQDGVKIESTNNVATINRVPQDPSSSGYGHGFDVNLNSPWVNHQFYQAGKKILSIRNFALAVFKVVSFVIYQVSTIWFLSNLRK